jgi:hypothetical protein
MLSSIYIDKIEHCLEKEGWIGINMIRAIVIFLLYVGDIVLLAKSIGNLHKQLKALKQFYKNYELTINI